VAGQRSELRQVGVFVGIFLRLSEKEGNEKSRGTKASYSPASRV